MPGAKEQMTEVIQAQPDDATYHEEIMRELAFERFIGCDLDVAVTLAPEATWSLYEWVDMIEELQEMFGRKVHLVEQAAVRNPYRRHEIATTKQILHAA